ncbi:MAG: hypothetical protein JNJ39_06130 [Blastocatellia bacterium]|nr:hypothetical protein [Blastocatellia bacterium]
MNIDELELSLRTEFEGQMRSLVAGIKQDVADFQRNLEAEYQKHREHVDRAVADFGERLPESFAFDAAFRESLTEHLRLARDEGAQIAATAFGEAEKLRTETHPEARYDKLRDAISEISGKTSQAAILSALVDHAANFAPRGAFFIVKNDKMVGWKTFSANVDSDPGRVRDVHFSTNSHSILSEAVGTLTSVHSHFGVYGDDKNFLEPLGFGQPEHMCAIPLAARGRGVAVLYVDKGDGGEMNIDALETLVRVAGLTVELHAATQSARVSTDGTEARVEMTEGTESATEVQGAPSSVDEHAAAEFEQTESAAFSDAPESDTSDTAADQPETTESEVGSDVPPVIEDFSETASVPFVEAPAASDLESQSFSQANEVADEAVNEYVGEITYEEVPSANGNGHIASEFEQFGANGSALETAVDEPAAETTTGPEEESSYETANEFEYEQPVPNGYEFASNSDFDASGVADASAEVSAPEVAVSGNGMAYTETAPAVSEPIVEVTTAQPVKSRFSERNVDLPIEVADEERRLHNDARRFARLLVSEIKLYNEQKVTEGREQSDLYDRLREAIDRSREMYDKRVQPAVASKFDYFHYELVNSLAEGDEHKLGGSYPGAAV